MVKKKRILICLIGVWVIMTAFNLQHKKEEQSSVVSAFSDAVSDECVGSVSAYGRYRFGNVSDGTKKIILQDIAKKIGINRYDYSDYTDEAGAEVKTLSQIGNNGDVVIKFIDKGDEQCYLYSQINLKDNVECIFTYEEILKEIYTSLDIQTNVNVNLKGTIAGYMENETARKYAILLMERSGAEFITDAKLDDAYTAYGYNKNEKNSVNIGGKNVNVNITVSYDESEGTTVIHLATPIMMQDF